MSVCQLISFLFCSRYSGHSSPLYMLVTTDIMLGLGGNVWYCLFFVYILYTEIQVLSDFSILQYTMSGTDGGECFLSPFHFMYQDYSKIFCIPMLHAAHGILVVKLLHSDWCRKYFRDQRFLGVIVRPTVTRLYRCYPISSRYVSVVIIRKHWKQEHWRYIVGDF